MSEILDIIKEIKRKRLKPLDKFYYILEGSRIITNDPPGSSVKFFVSPNNDVLAEIDHRIVRINYDILWIPFYEKIWKDPLDNKIIAMKYLIDKSDMLSDAFSVLEFNVVGGVSVKYLPYDKIGDNQRYIVIL